MTQDYQSTPSTNNTYPFLQRGGEMGSLMRSHNWAATPLGTPDTWPQSLRTTLSIILNSKFPMFLFWGEELICFYNDAYRPSLGGSGKHPDALGRPGAKVWPELWDTIHPLIEQVLAGEEATWGEDQLIPIYRNGAVEDVYWTFSYSPVQDESGQPAGVFVVCTETTKSVINLKKQEESETYFRGLTDTVPAILWITEPDGYCSYLNRQWYDQTGQTEAEAEGFGWLDATHPADRDEAGRLFLEANDKQIPFDALYRLRQKDGSYRWCIDKGKPRFGPNGEYEGIIGTVVDVHDQKQAEQIVQQSGTLFRNVANSSPTGLWLSDADGGLTYLNKTLVDWTGMSYDSLLGSGWASAIIDEDRPRSADTFLTAVAARGHYDVTFRLTKQDGSIIWCQAAGDPYYHEDGNYAGYAGFCMDIDPLVRQQQALATSEARFRSLIEEAPIATCLLIGRDLRIEVANEAMIDVWGKGTSVMGMTLADVLPELKADPLLPLLDDLFTTGQPYRTRASRTDLVSGTVSGTRYFDYTFKPLRNADGDVYAIMKMVVDVTEQVTAQARQVEQIRALAESEERFRALVEQAPVAIAVFRGDDFVFEMANDAYLPLIGKTKQQVMGKRMFDVIPETRALLEPIATELMRTGVPFPASEFELVINRHGRDETCYFNSVWEPLRESNGRISGFMAVAHEVTQQVMARQKIEEAQADLLEINQRLSLALDAGNLGSFELEHETGIMICTAQCRANHGQQPEGLATYSGLLDMIVADDRAGVQQAMDYAFDTQTIYHVEYRVLWPDGSLNWIKASGQPVCSPNGRPARMVGINQNITAQRMAREELERQVAQRTRQLQESVQDLSRSNQNLQQFAYIASHDLQEPLRKVQQFGDLLTTQYAEQLGEGVNYLQRMQSAASRMSVLIRDLLTFSRISTQQDDTAPVLLTDVVQTALNDLDMVIAEAGAEVSVEPLPTVTGDASQLGQLFQNLLSNALKFRRAGVTPVIRVGVTHVAADDLPGTAKPTRAVAAYYRIDVSDNGIGFDEKYADRIFQVFQRLHNKSEFAGTGIGLAICEKVAANHGGAITVASQPGQGATFSVYLPV